VNNENTTLNFARAALVYQGGIANVFSVDCFNLADYGREAKRLIQSDFHTCENFARGLAAAGVIVKVVGCNRAGDITRATWSDNTEDLPFSNKFATHTPLHTLI